MVNLEFLAFALILRRTPVILDGVFGLLRQPMKNRKTTFNMGVRFKQSFEWTVSFTTE